MKKLWSYLLVTVLAFAGGWFAATQVRPSPLRSVVESPGESPAETGSAPSLKTDRLDPGIEGGPELATLARMAAGLREEMEVAALMSETAGLSPAAIEELFGELAGNRDSEVRGQRKAIEDALIQQLLVVDPVRAWQMLTEQHPGEKEQSVSDRANRWYRTVFSQLAQNDLAAAKELVASTSISWLKDSAIETILESARGTDPAELLAWVHSMETGEVFRAGKESFEEMGAYMIFPDGGLFARWAKEDLPAARAYVLGLEPGPERRQGLDGLLETLCLEDPDNAVAFVNSLKDPAERKKSWYLTMHLLASSRPADAARLFDDMPASTTRMSALNALSRRWIKSDPAAAIDWLESLPDSRIRQKAYHAAIDQLGKVDPERAIQLADGIAGLGKRREAIDNVASQWFQMDPSAAADWLRSASAPHLKDEFLRRGLPAMANRDPFGAVDYFNQSVADGITPNLARAAGPLAYSYTKKDPEKALAWAENLSDPEARTNALTQTVYALANDDPEQALEIIDRGGFDTESAIRHMASTLAETDPDRAFEWIAEQPEQVRPEALGDALNTMAAQQPERAAEKLHQSLERLNENEAGSLTREAQLIARYWRKTDLDGALSWANELPDGLVRTQTLKELVPIWVDQDPHNASEWIAELEPGPVREDAVQSLAYSIGDEDPEASFQWSLTLEDESLRNELLQRSLEIFRETDPGAAEAALKAAEISPAEKGKLERVLFPKK